MTKGEDQMMTTRAQCFDIPSWAIVQVLYGRRAQRAWWRWWR